MHAEKMENNWSKPFVAAIQSPDVLNLMEKLIRNDAIENSTLMSEEFMLFYSNHPSLI